MVWGSQHMLWCVCVLGGCSPSGWVLPGKDDSSLFWLYLSTTQRWPPSWRELMGRTSPNATHFMGTQVMHLIHLVIVHWLLAEGLHM
jgi:hypothetical protein